MSAPTPPEGPHADLIARLRERASSFVFETDEEGLARQRTTFRQVMREAADALAALSDSVPREQYDEALAFYEQAPHADDCPTDNGPGYEGCCNCWKSKAPADALARLKAEVWEQAAAFVDEQREDFDGDLRQVRDRMKDHADWVREGAGS